MPRSRLVLAEACIDPRSLPFNWCFGFVGALLSKREKGAGFPVLERGADAFLHAQ